MKKIKKIIAILMLCVLAVSMVGCAELDEMKSCHGIWGEDKSTILYKGAVYRAILPSPMLQIWDVKDTIFVTDPDVPVLLSQYFGMVMSIGENEILLESHSYSAYGYTEMYPSLYYCREDYYDSVVERIQNGPDLSLTFYNYWDDNGQELFYHLSAEEVAAVDALLAGVPSAMGLERYSLNESFSFNLERSSSDYLFRDTKCEVVVIGRQICLVTDLENDGLVEVYNVPTEQHALFEKMIEKFSSMSWTGYGYEETMEYA